MKLALSRKNAWEKLPRRAKSALGAVVGAVPLPWLLGRRFGHALRFVEAAEWWSADQAQAYQLEELRRTVTLAYERTAYYRRTLGAVGIEPGDLRSIEDLRRLPLIDRHILREHLDAMCTVSPRSPQVDYTATGGTSGQPLGFYIDAGRSAVEYAYLVASWRRAGFRLGMPLAVFRGRPVASDRSGFRHEYDPLLRQHFYSNFHMTDTTMQRYLEHVRSIGSCFLHVYPSSAAALARFLRRAGFEAPSNICGLIAESENVYEDQRAMIEEAFGRRLFSCYGLTEKVVAAAECEHSTAYHVWPTYGVFELLDEAGHPVTTPGQRGEIVGTGFINTVVPFIRYRTGDFATYVADRCAACGRSQPIIAEIRGHRIQEVLVARDGSLITWTALNVHDDTYTRVLQFQFLQDTPGQARLRIVPAPGFSESDGQRLLRTFTRKLDGRLRLELELVDPLPLSPLGKAIYVDQRIPNLTPEGRADAQVSTAVGRRI